MTLTVYFQALSQVHSSVLVHEDLEKHHYKTIEIDWAMNHGNHTSPILGMYIQSGTSIYWVSCFLSFYEYLKGILSDNDSKKLYKVIYIAVMTDAAVNFDLHITDAQRIIHYDIPDRSLFNDRLWCMHETYSLKYHSQQTQVCACHISQPN